MPCGCRWQSPPDRLRRALIAANPDRLVFGTDWPHVHLPVPMANTGALLDELALWAPDLYVREKILVHNPARLYG